MNHRRIVPIIISLSLLPAGFQNCARGFESAGVLDRSSSAACKAQKKAEAKKQKWPAAELRCGDFASYSCERRVFSPTVETMSHSLKECLPGDSICVDVDVRQFNTSAALGPDSIAQDFQPGGSYNHEEVKCAHHWLQDGVALFTGDKDSLEEALSEAMSSCELASEKL